MKQEMLIEDPCIQYNAEALKVTDELDRAKEEKKRISKIVDIRERRLGHLQILSAMASARQVSRDNPDNTYVVADAGMGFEVVRQDEYDNWPPETKDDSIVYARFVGGTEIAVTDEEE